MQMRTCLHDKIGWIFDLDGTLTVPVHDFSVIRQELAIPEGEDILGHLGQLPEELAAPKQRRLDEIERELAGCAVAAPGVLALLDYLGQCQSRLGILTRNSREVALVTLEAIGAHGYFHADDVLGRAEAPPKPNPSGVVQLCTQWQLAAGQVVMVGDYLFDLLAGRSAGAATVHVARPDGQRWPAASDVSVETLDELLLLLKQT